MLVPELPLQEEKKITITIEVTQNGNQTNTSVLGFPADMDLTLNIMHRATVAIVKKFLDAAKKGELSDQLIKPANIDPKFLKGFG